jgi:hypothetical protein
VVNVLVAIFIGLGILIVGVLMTRAMSARRSDEEEQKPAEPEDVTELDVFFVCRECGTEFQVTRLGEAQVPRHCGELMEVEQRPRARPDLN